MISSNYYLRCSMSNRAAVHPSIVCSMQKAKNGRHRLSFGSSQTPTMASVVVQHTIATDRISNFLCVCRTRWNRTPSSTPHPHPRWSCANPCNSIAFVQLNRTFACVYPIAAKQPNNSIRRNNTLPAWLRTRIDSFVVTMIWSWLWYCVRNTLVDRIIFYVESAVAAALCRTIYVLFHYNFEGNTFFQLVRSHKFMFEWNRIQLVRIQMEHNGIELKRKRKKKEFNTKRPYRIQLIVC